MACRTWTLLFMAALTLPCLFVSVHRNVWHTECCSEGGGELQASCSYTARQRPAAATQQGRSRSTIGELGGKLKALCRLANVFLPCQIINENRLFVDWTQSVIHTTQMFPMKKNEKLSHFYLARPRFGSAVMSVS